MIKGIKDVKITAAHESIKLLTIKSFTLLLQVDCAIAYGLQEGIANQQFYWFSCFLKWAWTSCKQLHCLCVCLCSQLSWHESGLPWVVPEKHSPPNQDTHSAWHLCSVLNIKWQAALTKDTLFPLWRFLEMSDNHQQQQWMMHSKAVKTSCLYQSNSSEFLLMNWSIKFHWGCN